MKSSFEQIVNQAELVGLGEDILRDDALARKISYAGLLGSWGYEPEKSTGLTLGTAVPEASLIQSGENQPDSIG